MDYRHQNRHQHKHQHRHQHKGIGIGQHILNQLEGVEMEGLYNDLLNKLGIFGFGRYNPKRIENGQNTLDILASRKPLFHKLGSASCQQAVLEALPAKYRGDYEIPVTILLEHALGMFSVKEERKQLLQQGKLLCPLRGDSGFLAVDIPDIWTDPIYSPMFENTAIHSPAELEELRVAIADNARPIGLLSKSLHEYRYRTTKHYLADEWKPESENAFDKAWNDFRQKLKEKSESESNIRHLLSKLCEQNYQRSLKHSGTRSYRGFYKASESAVKKLAKEFKVSQTIARQILVEYERLPKGPMDKLFYKVESVASESKVNVILEQQPSGQFVALGIEGIEELDEILKCTKFKQVRKKMNEYIADQRKTGQAELEQRDEQQVRKEMEALGLKFSSQSITEEDYDRECQRLMAELELLCHRQDGEANRLAKDMKTQNRAWTIDEWHWILFEKKLQAYENRIQEDCLLAEIQANERQKLCKTSNMKITQDVPATLIAGLAQRIPLLKQRWKHLKPQSIERMVQRRMRSLSIESKI